MTDNNRHKSADFIAGFVYRAIEYTTSKNTDCFRSVPDSGFAGDVCFSKVWIGGKYTENVEEEAFKAKMEKVMQQLTDAFQSVYGPRLLLLASWEEYWLCRSHVVVKYRILKRQPQKMTVSEIEKALGYKIEIVSED